MYHTPSSHVATTEQLQSRHRIRGRGYPTADCRCVGCLRAVCQQQRHLESFTFFPARSTTRGSKSSTLPIKHGHLLTETISSPRIRAMHSSGEWPVNEAAPCVVLAVSMCLPTCTLLSTVLLRRCLRFTVAEAGNEVSVCSTCPNQPRQLYGYGRDSRHENYFWPTD